jgi:hypothetical protein
MADPRPAPVSDGDMRTSYVRVLVVWLATLLALFGFQEYFR